LTFSELTDRPRGDARRDDVAVCVCRTGHGAPAERSLAAVRAHTDATHSILVAGGEDTAGTVADLEAALSAAAPADVAVVAGGCVVTAGWLDGLRAAADSDPRIGVVSALASAGEISGAQLDASAARLSQASLRLRPDVPLPLAECVLVRRAALELAGPLDSSLTLAQSLADLTQRCLGHGLRHVLADDVLVGGMPPNGDARVGGLLARRYPYLVEWSEALAADSGSPAAMALSAARAGGRPPVVTVDARCLSVSVTGTAVATLDLVEALRTHAGVGVRALVLDDLEAAIRDRLTGIGVVLLHESEAATAEPTDIAHRPYQVGAPEDLLLLGRLGRRIVVTQLDSLAYRTPPYFDSASAWHHYRELTRAALASADAVVFLSPHAESDAQALGLVDTRHSTVIPLVATARPGASEDGSAAAPPGLDRPYLFCLGTDFAHKNRRFALRLLEALIARERFDGMLVFAGPHVTAGSSAAEEASYLADRPQLAERVIDVGAVGEAQKRQLLEGAAAVVYPTTFEGFGLIPFEAANLGVPTLFAWVTSLRDLFPAELALLVPWDAEASARAAASVLAPGEARYRQVEGVLAAGAALTASEYARRHAELYERALCRPEAGVGRIGRRAAELMTELERVRGDFRNVHRELDAIYRDPIASGFVGPHAIVPEELQRATLAVAGRPALRDRMVELYRLAHRR
jgi:hypothetical protein